MKRLRLGRKERGIQDASIARPGGFSLTEKIDTGLTSGMESEIDDEDGMIPNRDMGFV